MAAGEIDERHGRHHEDHQARRRRAGGEDLVDPIVDVIDVEITMGA
jgi:hypothetical protein